MTSLNILRRLPACIHWDTATLGRANRGRHWLIWMIVVVVGFCIQEVTHPSVYNDAILQSVSPKYRVKIWVKIWKIISDRADIIRSVYKADLQRYGSNRALSEMNCQISPLVNIYILKNAWQFKFDLPNILLIYLFPCQAEWPVMDVTLSKCGLECKKWPAHLSVKICLILNSRAFNQTEMFKHITKREITQTNRCVAWNRETIEHKLPDT